MLCVRKGTEEEAHDGRSRRRGAFAAFTFGAIGAQTAGTSFNVTLTATDLYGNAVDGAKALTFKGPSESPSEKAPSYPASVTFSGGSGTASVTPTASLSASTLTIASSGEATSTASTTYTSTNGSWSSDTLTAKSSPYTEATATLKK